ncbi:MAG: hypothetical protein QXV79_03455 [Thermofilaceae archaeon]
MRPLWLLLLIMPAALTLAQPTIYILNVRESQGWWSTPELLTTRIMDLLDTARRDLTIDFRVEVIDSIERWEDLLTAAPPNAVIVNAHGELVPVPPGYGVDWQTFYRDLAMNIIYKGWVWVNPIGYGFYYVTYNYTRTERGWEWSTLTVGPAGLDTLGGWLGIVATAWPEAAGGTPTLTDLGRHVFDVLGYNLPDTPNAPRPITTNVPASWYFYSLERENVTAYSCVTFQIGKGALLWGGWASSPTDQQAMVAVAMTLYYLFPAEIEAAQPKPKGLSPEQVILISWGVVVAVMVLLLVRVFLRRRV